MKYLFNIIFICLASSCTTTLMQVQTVSSKNVSMDCTNNFSFEDGQAVVKYNLWSEGGSISFSIFNKTDSALYIDPEKSYIIIKGYRYDYMNNKSIMGYDTMKHPGNIYYDASYIYDKKQALLIPPQTEIHLSLFNLNNKTIQEPDTTDEKYDSKKYSDKTSPLCFANYIAFSNPGEFTAPYDIQNYFWVSETQTYSRKNFNCLNITAKNSFYTSEQKFNPGGTIALAVITFTGAAIIKSIDNRIQLNYSGMFDNVH